MKKNFLVLGSGIFVSDVINIVVLAFFAHFLWPYRPKLLDSSISLTFFETRLKSESFDALDDLLGFQVQTLRPQTTNNQGDKVTVQSNCFRLAEFSTALCWITFHV